MCTQRFCDVQTWHSYGSNGNWTSTLRIWVVSTPVVAAAAAVASFSDDIASAGAIIAAIRLLAFDESNESQFT